MYICDRIPKIYYFPSWWWKEEMKTFIDLNYKKE